MQAHSKVKCTRVALTKRDPMRRIGRQTYSVHKDQLTFSLVGGHNCNFTTGEGRIQNAFVFRFALFRPEIVVKIETREIDRQGC